MDGGNPSLNWIDFDFKKLSRLLFLATLPFIAIHTQEKPFFEGWYDKPFSLVSSMTQSGFHEVLSSGKNIVETYLALVNTNKINQDLGNKNLELTAKLSQLETLKLENAQLRDFLKLKSRSSLTLVAAEVISSSSDLRHHSFWLNKGSEEGVKLGQAVLSQDTIIGSIIRTLPGRSQVLLLSDRFSVIDGEVPGRGIKGIVEGLGGSQALFKSFDNLRPLAIGDKIVSTGIDQAFPRGIPMAKIISIEKDKETGLPRVLLEVLFQTGEISTVFIVTSGSDIDHGFWGEVETP